MRLHPQATSRFASSKFQAASVLTILEGLSMAYQQLGPEAAELHLDWQKDEDTVEDGDLVPVIVIALRSARKPNVEKPPA